MDICIDGRLLDTKRNTGISRYTEFMIEYHLHKGNKVYLIVNDKSISIDGCECIYTSLKPYNIFHYFRYSNFLRKLPVKIIHIPFYSGIFNKKRNFDKTIIITVHDLMFRFIKGFFGKNPLLNYLKRRYINFIVKHSLSNSDQIISVSETTKTDILSIYNLKSNVIPEYSEIKGSPDNEILKILGLKPKHFFLYCGNNRPHKNVDFIINCFNDKPDEFPLILVGPHDIFTSNIKSTGIIPDSQLKSLYLNATAFIFASSYEGFGLPILESLNCRTNVIASDIPAFKEFKSPNVILYNLNNKDSFLRSIKKSINHKFIDEDLALDRYSLDTIYKNLDILFDSISL